MKILTRGDLDGMTSCVLISLVENIDKDGILFAHPKEVQDGKVPVSAGTIVVNLPYVKGAAMWFDHHISEEEKVPDIGPFKGKYGNAPSAARLVYEYYNHPDFERFAALLEATDKLDSARLSMDDVVKPKDWILLGYTLDPRTGLGPEFQKYFRWLVEYVKEVPVEKILEHPEVAKRAERVLTEQEAFKAVLSKRSRVDGNVIVTDFRGQRAVGNRFLVYAMFPQANVECRIFSGKEGQSVNLAIGHSIFTRTCKTNVGKLCAEYGGGGHAGAGSCQLSPKTAKEQIVEIIERLKKNG